MRQNCAAPVSDDFSRDFRFFLAMAGFVPGEVRKGALTGDMSPIHASSSKNKVADYGTTRVP